jgi:hypothetical protein
MPYRIQKLKNAIKIKALEMLANYIPIIQMRGSTRTTDGYRSAHSAFNLPGNFNTKMKMNFISRALDITECNSIR